MKKIIYLLFLTIIIISCSSSDSNNDSGGCLNPPGWLIGSWVKYYSNGMEIHISNRIVVTNDDVVYYDYNSDGTLATTPMSVKNSYCNNSLHVVNQEITNEYYMWNFTFGEAIGYRYFYKLNETSFSYDNFASGADPDGSVYIKE